MKSGLTLNGTGTGTSIICLLSVAKIVLTSDTPHILVLAGV